MVAVHENEKAEQCLSMNPHAMENGKINGRIKEHLGLGNHKIFSQYGLQHSIVSRPFFYTVIGSLLFNVILIIIIFVLAALVTSPGPCPTPPTTPADYCPEGWIGYRRRCYYFVEAESNWTSSKINCSSFNASLAVVDSKEEMDVLRRYKSSADYWIGLQRDVETDPWKWINGTIFNNWFSIRGGGECAYMNHKGIGSSSCLIEQAWICSKPVNR
ncbi:C-type lectin domain family 2 member B-like [Elgaria multicarinata webbii]|uniref:C-type lectin domain family 2 member B-like n=1 Tax=Elgaria multicarinata webbii TaxID=159646 RepID=UPI002FCD5DFA